MKKRNFKRFLALLIIFSMTCVSLFGGNNAYAMNEEVTTTQNADIPEIKDAVSEIILNNGKGSVTLNRLDENKMQKAGVIFELYGIVDNGTEALELENFKGMNFYSLGVAVTDESGIVKWTGLSTDEAEWYIAKDFSTGNLVNIGNIPYVTENEPPNDYLGTYELEEDIYNLFDVMFNVSDNEAKVILPGNEEQADSILPTMFKNSTDEVSVQASDKYSWTYPLYSSTGVRDSGVKITGKADFYYGGTLGSIFKVTGNIYATCAQHAKSTVSDGKTVTESIYKGNNAAQIRKLLYYGYGGYDKGKAFISEHGSKVDSAYLAFATIISMSHYYSGVSCFDSWDVMQDLRAVVSDKKDPAGDSISNAATDIYFKRSGKEITKSNAHTAADDKDYNNSGFYYSDWITIKSDGAKEMTMTAVNGVTVYRKRGDSVSGPKVLNEYNYKNGDKVKFRFNKTNFAAGKKVTVKLASEGGIVSFRAIVGKTESSMQDIMRAYVTTAKDKTASIAITMPSEVTVSILPQYSNVKKSATITHVINLVKKSTTGEYLEDAKIKVTAPQGEKTAVTNAEGKAALTFTYTESSKTYMYITNASSLTQEQKTALQESGYYLTKAEADKAAQAEVDKKLNRTYEYTAQETSAPAGYKLDKLKQNIVLGKNDKSYDFEFVNEKEKDLDIGVADFETYYYQEVDIGKVLSEDNTKVITGAEFSVGITDVSSGSTLVKILYPDANGNTRFIENTSGINQDATTSQESKWERRNLFNVVPNLMTNENGVIRVGYVYKMQAVGNYSYIKNYNGLDAELKKKADKLIEEEGYYITEESAQIAARREVTERLKNLNNSYYIEETKKPTLNPLNDGRDFLELEDMMEKKVRIFTELKINQYAEIRYQDALSMYNRNSGIKATDSIF